MSARDDARLAAREHLVPGLALLLDDDAFAAALAAALPDAGIEGARATYVRYKPATSCLVAYRVRTRGAEHDVYARAHEHDADEKLDSARKRSRERSPLGPGGLVLDGAVAVHVFPHDRRLRPLRRLTDPDHREKLLRRALPGREGLWTAPAHTLRYKPERRWVARLSTPDGEPDGLLKLHGHSGFSEALAAAAALSGVPGAPVARLLGAATRQGALVLEWLDGEPLDSALDGAGDDVVARLAAQAGEALAALHAADAPKLPSRDEDDLAWRLSAALAATAAVVPEVAQRAARVSARLADASPRPELRPVHGDCSIDQMVATADGVRLLDLDAASHDDPAVDLGACLADLEARVLRGVLPAATAAAARDALLAGYEAAGGPGATAGPGLARHTASALLLRAPEPFRGRDPEWAARTTALVERAERIAADGGVPAGRRAPASASAHDAPAGDPTRTSERARAHRRPTPPAPLAGMTVAALELLEPSPAESAALGLPEGRLTLRRAWPQGGGGLALEYRAPGGALVAALWTADPRDLDRSASATPPVGATAVHYAGGRRVLLQAGGADRRLPGLAPALAEPGATLVSHRAERRAVVRRDGDHVKVVRPQRTAGLVEAARMAHAVAAGAAFTVPEPTAVDEKLGIVRFPTLPGTPLPDLLGGPRSAEAAAAAGAALRALHDAPLPAGAPPHDAAAEVAVIERWTGLLAAHAVAPGSPAQTAAGSAAYMGETVRARLERGTPTPAVPIHRDLHDKQLLVDRDGAVAMLDFDTLAAGEAALDLANLLVHIELRALQRGGVPAEGQEAVAAIIDGYGPGDAVRARLDAYADATRLRLACVYAFRPTPDGMLPALLSRLGRPVAAEPPRSRPAPPRRPEPLTA